MDSENKEPEAVPVSNPGEVVTPEGMKAPESTTPTPTEESTSAVDTARTTLADMEKMHKKPSFFAAKKKLLMTFLIIVLLGLGGFLAWQNFKPGGIQSDLDSAIAKFIKLENVGATLELPDGFSEIPFVSSFQIDSTIPALGLFIEVDVPADVFGGVQDATVSLDFRGIGDKWYFELHGLDNLLNLTSVFLGDSVDEVLGQELIDAIGSFDDMWVYFDTEIIKSIAGEYLSASEVEDMPEIGIDQLIKPSDFTKLSNLYLKHPFVKVVSSESDEDVGSGYVKVELGFDEVNGKKFVDAFLDTTFENEIWNEAKADETKEDNVVEADDTTFFVWMVDGEIVRIPMTEEDDIFLNLTYGSSSATTVPEGATPLDLDFLSGLFVGLVGNTFDAEGTRARARDAERQTDLIYLNTLLEVYYVENGYYPSGGIETTCGSDGASSCIFSANLFEGLNQEALNDPDGNPIVTLVITEDSLTENIEKGKYYYLPTGCSSGHCQSFDLTSDLEDDTVGNDVYVKKSLN